MKLTAIAAIALIVLGVIALAYEGITYTKSRTVLDIGPIQAKVEERRTVPLSPILGSAAIICGIALLVIGSRSSQAA